MRNDPVNSCDLSKTIDSLAEIGMLSSNVCSDKRSLGSGFKRDIFEGKGECGFLLPS